MHLITKVGELMLILKMNKIYKNMNFCKSHLLQHKNLFFNVFTIFIRPTIVN